MPGMRMGRAIRHRAGLAVFAIFLSVFSAAQDPGGAFEAVNPFIGTEGHGHTFPGAVMPFGMVQLSPDTQTRYFHGTRVLPRDACIG
jgi:putative alpha-1,2-mannosidase